MKLPRLVWWGETGCPQTRPAIEFARGYKLSQVITYVDCSTAVKSFPIRTVDKEFVDSWYGRHTDPASLERAIRTFLKAHWITERAKLALEEMLVTFEIETKTEPQIRAHLRLMLDKLPKDSKLTSIPARFPTKEKALERYNAMVAEIAALTADKEAKDEPAAPAAKKSATKKSQPNDEESDMAAAKKATKKSTTKKSGPTKTRSDALSDDTKIVAKCKLEDLSVRADSRRTKTLKKIIAAGARGITVGALKAEKGDIKKLMEIKRVAIIK